VVKAATRWPISGRGYFFLFLRKLERHFFATVKSLGSGVAHMRFELTDFPTFLELGAWTIFYIQPVFELFRDEHVAPALALIIFGTALLLCFLFVIDTSYIRTQVRRRTRALGKIKDKTEFAERMPQIEKLMLRSRYLRHSWQKFRETLIEPVGDQEDASKIVLNTARPQNYFNTAEAGLRFALYRAMPNLLVGIGLLLTFLGLVSALFFTTAAIKGAADLATSQNALRDLLYAASFKFYTSIAGLGGSILLTLVIRHGVSAIESSFDSLAVRASLKQHQIRGLVWLQESWSAGQPGVLLADDMGLGKTVQTLAFLAWLREKRVPALSGTKRPILIVAPTGLLANWEKEHETHLHVPGLGEICRLYGRHLKALRSTGGRDARTQGLSLDHRRIQQTAAFVLDGTPPGHRDPMTGAPTEF
jgi:hypothetical protein